MGPTYFTATSANGFPVEAMQRELNFSNCTLANCFSDTVFAGPYLFSTSSSMKSGFKGMADCNSGCFIAQATHSDIV